MFTDGPEDAAISAVVHADLRFVTSATLLVYELRIGLLVGRPRLRRWAGDWIASNGLSGGRALGIQTRRDLL